MAKHAEAIVIVPASKRGRLVKLKKLDRVKLNVEITIDVEPGDGAFKIRVAASERPTIIPKNDKSTRQNNA